MAFNRRHFFKQLASGLIVATAPALFLPKSIKPKWRRGPRGFAYTEYSAYEIPRPIVWRVLARNQQLGQFLYIPDGPADESTILVAEDDFDFSQLRPGDRFTVKKEFIGGEFKI